MNSAGDCVAGDQNDACGLGGGLCNGCPSGSMCSGGACLLPCAMTCDGCCDGAGTCQPGTDDATCGALGETCGACETTEACSDFGVCQDTACEASCAGCCSGTTCLGGDSGSACGEAGSSCLDCGTGFGCADTDIGSIDVRFCVPEDASTFDVFAISAVVPLLDSTGEAWDLSGGQPDPYVELTATDTVTSMETTGSSANVNDTLTPTWNEQILTSIRADSLDAGVDVTVWDDDFPGDDEMGSCTWNPSPPAFFFEWSETVECGAGITVELRLRHAP